MGLNRDSRVEIFYGIMRLEARHEDHVEVPDDLYRRVKAEAALRGRKLAGFDAGIARPAADVTARRSCR
jgi:hypothetical protein